MSVTKAGCMAGDGVTHDWGLEPGHHEYCRLPVTAVTSSIDNHAAGTGDTYLKL